MAANKCDITSIALDTVGKAYWGVQCEDKTCEIVKHYITYLNCATVRPFHVKGYQGCTTDTFVFNCNFNVLKSTLLIAGNELSFTLGVGDIEGGKAPFTYKWSFDSDDFTPSSATNEQTLNLKLNDYKNLQALVSKITVDVEDADGCKDTKSCYLVNGALQCYNNYVPCANPNNLILTSKFTQCGAPSGLILTKN